MFKVEINTTFMNVSHTHYLRSSAGLTFFLNCGSMTVDTLICRIDEGNTSYFPTTKPKRQINDTFIPLPLLFEGIQFTIKFDSSGVTDVRIANNSQIISDWWKLLHLYRIIADQLNIGTDLSRQYLYNFQAKESSYIGKCQTVYEFSEDFTNQLNENLTLTSISNSTLLNFSGNNIQRIRKRRNLYGCALDNNIYVAMLLWQKFIPESDYKMRRVRIERFACDSLEQKNFVTND